VNVASGNCPVQIVRKTHPKNGPGYGSVLLGAVLMRDRDQHATETVLYHS
jgi:hypothetical protein